MYQFFLTEKDQKQRDHFPIISLINEACNIDMMEFLGQICSGVGIGYNFSNCTFWNDLDDYEKKSIPQFDGVLVSTIAGEEVIATRDDILYYLGIALERIELTDAEKRETSKLLDRYRNM
jgi:hypothetical protein